MKNKPIGVFDSGVGGLTVVRSIIDLLPGEDVIYIGDDERGPYGPRDPEEVKGFAKEIIEYLIEMEVKLVVIACNTATAAYLEEAQRNYKIPIVGVIMPGARAALRESRSKEVGVIGTVGTVDSGSYEKDLVRIDKNVRVHSRACPEFVEFVERNEVYGERITGIARTYLEPLVENGIDALILGCTHYPLLEDLIIEVVGPGVTLISSADETAAEVKDILEKLGWLNESESPGRVAFLTTGDVEKCKDMGRRFLGPEIKDVLPISLDKRPVVTLKGIWPD